MTMLWHLARHDGRCDERTVETMSRGERTQRKERVVVVVGECSRLGAACLAQAYEQVVPVVRRPQTVGSGDGHAGREAQHRVAGGAR